MHAWAVLSGFFKWLYRAELINENPMARIEPPRRQPPEGLDVVTVTGSDVRRLFDVCETWGELLCLSTLAYRGPRRGAVSQLRWREVDFERGTIRFKEKGGKPIKKPIPDEFHALLVRHVSLARSSPVRTTTWCRCGAGRSMVTIATTA